MTLKLNVFHMFINKFDSKNEILDLDKLKRNFRLDEGETGFYKLSISQKKVYGDETINETYNRPPIGPIEENLYCTYCERIGPEDHDMECEFPDKDSLNLTFEAFVNYIINNDSYDGYYKELKNKILNKTVNQDDINEILIIENSILVVNGVINLKKDLDVQTNISYFGIYKKRGIKKRAKRTSTTQFLNNLMISYEKNDKKTSIRISKNGLINLINSPEEGEELENLIEDLLLRINESDSVDIENFREETDESQTEYTFIREKSYIYDIHGQYIPKIFQDKKKILNFEELDKLISPRNRGEIIPSPGITTIEYTPDKETIINLMGLKIIDWVYSLENISETSSTKEYIKFVAIASPGIKLTGIMNKSGSIMVILSLCNQKENSSGLCGEIKETPRINKNMFSEMIKVFEKIFQDNSEILTKDNLSSLATDSKIYNTVTGYAPTGKTCRLTRTRDSGDENYKESMRPFPYSWKGSCPDPNYQFMRPQGILDEKSGLWFPCCETKTKKSIEEMKNYLLTGFPKNKQEAKKYNVTEINDLGSGILIPGSNDPGSKTDVLINGIIEEVEIVKKLSKKSNDYKVKRNNGEIIVVNGNEFIRDSRKFRGLLSFDKNELIDCIMSNLYKNDMIIDENGTLKKRNISNLNEKYEKQRSDLIKSLINPESFAKKHLTYRSLKRFKTEKFAVKNVPIDSFHFFLHLGPNGNFYIDSKLYSIESQISKYYSNNIILSGYLRYNEEENKNEYHLLDLIYKDTPLTTLKLEDRIDILLDIYNTEFFNITDELFLFTEPYYNVIEGSYNLINEEDDTNKLIFISENCCDIITFGEKDLYTDKIPMQIINKQKNVISFGHSGKIFPSNLGLDFLTYYNFNKRDIPENLYLNDYFNIKINRDYEGRVVQNRKISILDKTSQNYGYEETLEMLLIKLNPIKDSFFNSDEEWVTLEGEVLIYNNGLLIAE